MDDRLKDRIAVITGANQGIGRSIAQRFAASGARIVCADMKADGDVADALNAQYGPNRALYVRCDVTSASDVESLIAQAAAWGDGRVDIACNFAGAIFGGTTARVHELAVEHFDATLAVNTRGVWLSCKYELAQMLAQEPRATPNARGDRTRGWIVNAASIYGLVGVGNCSHYTTSKHAVVGMTKEMAIDYSKDRIHINCVCPGWIRTAFLPTEQEALDGARLRHPWGELGSAEDVANAVLFLCSDDNTWCSGTALVVDGGYTAM